MSASAMLYKAEGLQTKAIKQLEKALEADPDHASAREALEELTGGEEEGRQGPFRDGPLRLEEKEIATASGRRASGIPPLR